MAHHLTKRTGNWITAKQDSAESKCIDLDVSNKTEESKLSYMCIVCAYAQIRRCIHLTHVCGTCATCQ